VCVCVCVSVCVHTAFRELEFVRRELYFRWKARVQNRSSVHMLRTCLKTRLRCRNLRV